MSDPLPKTLLEQVAPFASAIAILVTGATGFLLYPMRWRREEHEWFQVFRDSHVLFWENKEIAEVRRWISNPNSYLEIQPILHRRGIGPQEITPEEYKQLEKIDQFCALLHRVAFLDIKPLSGARLRAWRKSYYNYWLTEAAKKRELEHYIRTNWPGLFELKPPPDPS